MVGWQGKFFTLDCLKQHEATFFLPVLSYCKTSVWDLVPEDFYEKEFIKELFKKSFDNVLN